MIAIEDMTGNKKEEELSGQVARIEADGYYGGVLAERQITPTGGNNVGRL
jgi:hypothetical protein